MPAGVSEGGQFATGQRDEADVRLTQSKVAAPEAEPVDGYAICPKCRRDIRVTKAGAWAVHSRPVTVPRGVASVRCTQSGKPATPPDARAVPAPWARAAVVALRKGAEA